MTSGFEHSRSNFSYAVTPSLAVTIPPSALPPTITLSTWDAVLTRS
jgi:hypothetical protein